MSCSAPSARRGRRWAAPDVDRRLVPVAVVVVAAGVWGLFWIPLRAFEAQGLAAGWTTLAQFVTPALILLPFALHRLARGRPTGLRHAATGFAISAAFVLYYESLLLTEVVRSLLLFYITPVWGTLLELAVMRRRLTKVRVLALALGLCGLYVVLGGESGLPVPRNLGDVMALVAGMIFAVGAMRIRQSPGMTVFEHAFAFFVYGGVLALAIALLPVEEFGAPPAWATLAPLVPWLVAMAVVFLIPVMWGLLWGSAKVDPGRLGILLQMEAVVGIGSAAILADEPFGLREASGTVLIIGAGVLDVLGARAPRETAPETLAC